MKHSTLESLISARVQFCIIAGEDVFGSTYNLVVEESASKMIRHDLTYHSVELAKNFSVQLMTPAMIVDMRRLISEKRIKYDGMHQPVEGQKEAKECAVYIPTQSPVLRPWTDKIYEH